MSSSTAPDPTLQALNPSAAALAAKKKKKKNQISDPPTPPTWIPANPNNDGISDPPTPPKWVPAHPNTDPPDPNTNNNNNNNGGGGTNDLTIVAGKPNKNDPGQMNVQDYAGQLITDPSLGFTGDNPKTATDESMMLSDRLDNKHDIADMNQAGLINGGAYKYNMNADKYSVDNQEVNNVKEKNVKGYNVATTADKIGKSDIDAAQGQIQGNDLVKAAQTNILGVAAGAGLDTSQGADNAVGQALAKYAAIDMSNIIDTSTSAGKLLAQQLGDGNYVDSKATLQGQLELLQQQFVDPITGEPKIPSWAAGTARNVSKISAFKGMSGTAATAAMSQALLEASIPIAQADSQFFQTLTLQNLDNRQQSVINTANTLSKFEQTNTDNRMAAAIQNAKNFMDMDMANLSNDQQAKVINNQQRVQGILEDAKSVNAERLFVSGTQADMDKFYDSLNTQINQYNSSQNLDAQKFNSTMADSREKFEKEMSYNIDVANAKWRQEVQLNEDQQQFEASTTDVKNMVDLSVNQLNQVWDRSDALLDYAWKSSESDLNRKNELAKIALAGDAQMNSQMLESLGLLAGTFVGSGVGQSLLKGIFG